VAKSEFAFPNDVAGDRLSENALLAVIERMGRKGTTTTHGFRSTFRTWALEQTSFPWELAELSLGHTVGSKVERAYARGDAFQKRRAIMDAWARHCEPSGEGDKVVQLKRINPGLKGSQGIGDARLAGMHRRFPLLTSMHARCTRMISKKPPKRHWFGFGPWAGGFNSAPFYMGSEADRQKLKQIKAGAGLRSSAAIARGKIMAKWL
jgi:hypothetical protein